MAEPTVIDEFVVKLGLDPSQFSDEQNKTMAAFKKRLQEAEKGGKALESQGKKLLDFFVGLKREALTAMAGFLGGRELDEFVHHITSMDAAAGRMARTLGMSVEELSQWQSAFEQVGGTAESATSAVQGISSAINAATITGEVPLFARYIGGIFDQTTHKAKTAGEVIKQLSDMVRGMDPAVATAFLNRAVPGINQDAINLILRGRNEIDEYLKAAREAGGITRNSSEESRKYQVQVGRLSRAFESLQRALFMPALPYLTSYVERLVAALNNLREGKLGSGGLWLGRKLGIIAEPGAAGHSSIPLKPGAGSFSPATFQAAEALAQVQGIKEITALNDTYHGGRGLHGKGRAIDLSITDPAKSSQVAAAIRARLEAKGIEARVIDEYLNPSANATAGHIHVGLGARGGITNSSSSSNTQVSIGSVTVVAPNAKNADDVARELPAAVRRVGWAASVNQGPQ